MAEIQRDAIAADGKVEGNVGVLTFFQYQADVRQVRTPLDEMRHSYVCRSSGRVVHFQQPTADDVQHAKTWPRLREDIQCCIVETDAERDVEGHNLEVVKAQ